MNRTSYIAGRVIRNLEKYGIAIPEFGFILDEIGQAVNRIISDVKMEFTLSITMVKDQSAYPLVSDSIQISYVKNEDGSFVLNEDGSRIINSQTVVFPDNYIIGEVRTLILPSSWLGGIKYISNGEFSKLDLTTTGEQPAVFTVFENAIHFFPVNNVGGETVKLLTTLNSSPKVPDEDTDPYVPPMWDKAIEYLTTSEFMVGDFQNLYFGYYEREILKNRPKVHNKKIGGIRVGGGW